MSTIAATNLKNASAGSNNIVLGTDGSSTLTTAKVTTLADSAGSNTSTPAEIASGRAKAWVNFDGTSNSNNLSGTYSQSGTTVTVTVTAHGLIAGNVIYADATSGTAVDGTYTVATVTDANTFTYTAGTSLTTSGNVTIRRNPIRASYNVSSITDNGVGDYTVNFTTALVDTNYVVVASSGGQSGGNIVVTPSFTPAITTISYRISHYTYSGEGNVDMPYLNVAVFR